MQLPPKHPGVGEVRYPDLRRSGMDSTGDAIGYTFATASVESFGSTANELIFFTKLNWQKKLVYFGLSPFPRIVHPKYEHVLDCFSIGDA